MARGPKSTFPSHLLTSARACWENSTEEADLIKQISTQFHTEILDELAAVPEHGSPALTKIATIADLDQFCRDAMHGPRECTYELSNIGMVEMPPAPVDGPVQLEKLVFSQCGMVAGPAFGCSVVSTKDGPLVLSVLWQEEIVSPRLMSDLRDYVERRLMTLRERRD